MNRTEACRILGISGKCNTAQLKKRYRQLLHLVHPDGAAFRQRDEEYPYGFHEIQEAYAVLSEEQENTIEKPEFTTKSRTQGCDTEPDDPDAWMHRNPEYAKAVWDAEENADAFCQREILQYMEDFDGTVLGVFTLTRGKFLWKPEEEFPLFLQSISRATAKVMQDVEEEIEEEIFGEGKVAWGSDPFEVLEAYEARRDVLKQVLKEKLTYLLSQQFIDAANTLEQLVQTKRSQDGSETIYYIPAMLESGTASPGEMLYPEKMEQHRLFLKNQQGDSVGYLSFPDDRMYYLVVPLFEQRRVQVKIKVRSSEEAKKGRTTRSRYGRSSVRLNLWLKFKAAAGGVPEDSNSQIRALLDGYRKELLKCIN